jgi:hypothetical protein
MEAEQFPKDLTFSYRPVNQSTTPNEISNLMILNNLTVLEEQFKWFVLDTNKCTSDIHKYNLSSVLHLSASRHPEGAVHQDLKITKIKQITNIIHIILPHS